MTNITKESHIAWLKKRQEGIGGSDIAAILGKSPFKKQNKLKIYYSKVLPIDIDEEENPILIRGNEAEPHILNKYEKMTGRTIERALPTIVHKKHPMLFANVDGYHKESNTIIEAKLATRWGNKDAWIDSEGKRCLPLPYLLQVAHYCNVMDADGADVIVRFEDSWEHVIITYKRDKELEEVIEKAAITFWNKYVLSKIEPTVDGENFDLALRNLSYLQEAVSPKVAISLPLKEELALLREKAKIVATLEGEIKNTKAKLLQYAKGNNTYCLYDNAFEKQLINIIKYKGKETLDSKKIKQEAPEIYEKYKKISSPYYVMKINKEDGND